MSGAWLELAALVMVATGLAARFGLRRDQPWLPAAVAAALYAAGVQGGYDPALLAPVVGAALLAGLAMTRLDGGRPGIALLCGFIVLVNLDALSATYLSLRWHTPSAGMPVLPVVLALWAAFHVSEPRHKLIYLLLGLVGLWTVAGINSSAYTHRGQPGEFEYLPLLTVLIYAVSRRLYPAAKSAGPALTALFIGSLLLLTVAGSWAELRTGAPVAGWLGCCFAALLPAVIDESRAEPDRSFGLDRYFAEALALAGALGLGWLRGF